MTDSHDPQPGDSRREPAPTPPAAWESLPSPAPVPPEQSGRRLSLRGRGALVGAAALVVALSGAGGYAIAHAASDGSSSGGPGRFGGGPGGGLGTPPGFGQRDGGADPRGGGSGTPSRPGN
jgi:translation initiation factor IF-2